MNLIKRNLQKSQKRIFIKTILIVLFVFFIYLSLAFDSDYIKNNMYKAIYKQMKDDNFFREDNINCDKYDPIFLMGERFKENPISLCKSQNSNHICFRTSYNNNYNTISSFKYGVLCKSENFILDPLKSFHTNYIYKGPVDKINKGAPILYKGFFNMKCDTNQNFKKFNKIYKTYFNAWKYENFIVNDEKINEEIPELASGKTILFISRNQDSPNIFHGISELLNALSVIYLFNLSPENIQIIFLESMKLQNDPFFDLYKNIISRGGEPLYIRNMKQKYHISSAIHIPINWDSPLFIKLSIPKGFPDCKYPTQAYSILNNLINKYFNISIFKDSFISDGDIFYYPESVIQNYKLNNNFNKTITIQWRKVWPPGRINQQRILGNGPELADKLSSIVPKNYLIRLVDTASLPIIEQISIMRKTDYLIGVHGAGLSLSIFMPYQSVLYEILPKKKNRVLVLMSALSGHKVYSDVIKSELKIINKNQVYFFDSNQFIKKVIKYIK